MRRDRGQHGRVRSARRPSSRRATSRPKKEAEKLAEKLDGQQFVVIRSASDAGALYGSVTTRDAADAATEAGVSRSTASRCRLSSPIKELGLHSVQVVLHPEVEVTIVLNVARSPEEGRAAGRRARRSQNWAAEEEAAAEFEIDRAVPTT